MADERIRIIAELVGVNEGIKTLDELKRAVSELEKRKVELPVDIDAAKRSMKEFDAAAKKYSGYSDKMKDQYVGLSKVWKVNADIMRNRRDYQRDVAKGLQSEYDGVRKALGYAKLLTKEWEDEKKVREDGEKQMLALRDAEAKSVKKNADDAYKQWLGQEKAKEDAIAKRAKFETDAYYAQIANDEKAAAEAEKSLQKLYDIDKAHYFAIKEDEQRMAEERQKRIDQTAHGFQMLTNGFARAFEFSSDLSTTVGKTFSGMASLFETNFIDVARIKMASMFINLVKGNIGAAISRADIMNTFIPYMQLAGVTEEDAQAALNRVDLSIRGLPIGLDEAAQRLRRYQMFLGDTQRATDLTIGIQKAITAGGAPESFKTQAYYMIDRLLTAGTLSTSRQWYSLINGLGVSVRFLSEAMGVGKITAAEFAAGLASKKYSVEQFLDAVVALGNGTATSAAQLDQALGIYKSTFESWLSNIRFAVVRGTTNVINAIDEVLEGSTGKKITGYMEELRDGFNSMFSGAADWVRNNPEPIVRAVDAIKGLVGAFGSINMGGIAGGIMNNFARVLEYLADLLSRVSGSQLSEFVSFATTIAGPIGLLMTKLAGTLPMLLGVFQRFKDFDFEGFVDKLITQIGAFANVIEGVLRLLPDGLWSNLMAFALVWGRPLATVIRLVGGALIALGSGKVAAGLTDIQVALVGATGTGGLLGGLKKIAVFLATNPIGWLIDIAAAVIGVTIAVRQHNKAMREAAESTEGILRANEVAEEASNIRQSSEDARKSLEDTVGEMDAQAAQTRALVDELKALNSEVVITDENQARMAEIISQLNGLYPDWNLGIDNATKHLDNHTKAVLDNVDAILAMAKAEAIGQQITSLYSASFANKNQLHKLRVNIAMSEGSRDKVYRDYEAALNKWRPILHEEGYTEASIKDYVRESPYIYNGVATEFGAALDAADASLKALKDERDALDSENAEIEKDIKYYGSLMNDLNKQADGATEALHDFSDGAQSVQSAISATSDELADLADKYREVKDAAKDSIDSQLEGFEELDEFKPTSIWDMIKGMQQRNDRLKRFIEDQDTIYGFNPEKAGISMSDFAGFASYIIEQGEEASAGLASAIKSKSYDAIKKAFNEWALLDKNSEYYATMSANINTYFEGLIDDSSDYVTRIALKAINESSDEVAVGIDEVIEKLESYEYPLERAAYLLGTTIEEIERGIEDKQSGTLTAIATLLDQVEQGILTKKQAIVDAMYNLGSEAAMSLQYSLGTNERGPIKRARFATGGMVYASNGMFIPMGTDTVPAMLTPGEFVVNRKATQTIGAHILQQINSLDIPGALRSLMHRVPSLGGAPIINNTSNRDNHASVTQNFFNSGDDGFAYRRANRFVRALV